MVLIPIQDSPLPPPASGILRFVVATPNPAGSLDALFLADGDATATAVSAIEGPLPPPLPSSTLRRLRLFHFNDLHNRLVTTDASGADIPLFSRIVRRYRDARARAPVDEVVVLLSGGDDHTGNVLDELLGWRPHELVVDPAYEAYSAAGVEAATLGNHELDRGAAVLQAGIRTSAKFPILSANVRGAADLVRGRDYFAAAIAVAKGLRIGMIGLTTTVDTRTRTTLDPGLEVASPLATLRHLLPALAARSDVVIVMSHCGYGVSVNRDGKAGAPRALDEGDIAIAGLAATLTDRPVFVLGGHTHTVLNANGLGPDTLIDGVPILQAGGHGSHLGEFVAELRTGSRRGDWTVRATLHPFAATDGAHDPHTAREDHDRAFETSVIAPLLARVAARVQEVVATTADDPALSRAATLRARYTGECALANFKSDGVVARSADFPGGRVDFAIINSTALGDGLVPGRPVTFRDLYAMLPFADCLQVGEITGAQLRAILANNAHRIVRPEEIATRADRGKLALLDVEGYVSRGFLHFSAAVRYTIVLGDTARAATIADASVLGMPLDEQPERRFRVAFTNYLGAGGYGEAWNGNPIGAGVPGDIASIDFRRLPKADTGLVLRNEVIAHARAVGQIAAATGARLDGRLTVAVDRPDRVRPQ